MFERKEEKIKKKTPLKLLPIKLAVYEIRWKNIVEPDRPHMAI